jgi:hypothetical protein
MARLSIISLDGAETWTPHLNDAVVLGEHQSTFNLSEWTRWASQDAGRSVSWKDYWTISPERIEFSYYADGDEYRWTWEGRFNIKGDTIEDGVVTAFEKKSPGGYGHIRIDQVSIPVKGEFGMFWTLTVPTEISEALHLLTPIITSTDPDPVIQALWALRQGDEYLFTTAYDSNALSTQSPQEPQESYSQSLSGVTGKADVLVFSEAPSYGAGQADVITNFRPEEGDTLSIETGLFAGASGTPRLKIAKNTKVVKKLSRSTTDFIYDKSSGCLYFNENGKGNGFGDGGVFAIIDGKISIQPANVSFI